MKEIFAIHFLPKFDKEIRQELSNFSGLKILADNADQLVCEGVFSQVVWAQQVWRDCQLLNIESNSKAALFLKPLSPRWIHKSAVSHRKSELIQDKLRTFKSLELSTRKKFDSQKDLKLFGGFSLITETQLVFTKKIEALWHPSGPVFTDEKDYPSRAYQKLLEFFSINQLYPSQNSNCLEIGASPGGWTLYLARLGCKVLAVDRSPLDDSLSKFPGVKFEKGDGLKYLPSSHPNMNWVFSDAIIYPEKIIPWIKEWVKTDAKIICTIKFQGPTNFAAIQELSQIPGSGFVHLYANKHELTWYRI